MSKSAYPWPDKKIRSHGLDQKSDIGNKSQKPSQSVKEHYQNNCKGSAQASVHEITQAPENGQANNHACSVKRNKVWIQVFIINFNHLSFFCFLKLRKCGSLKLKEQFIKIIFSNLCQTK